MIQKFKSLAHTYHLSVQKLLKIFFANFDGASHFKNQRFSARDPQDCMLWDGGVESLVKSVTTLFEMYKKGKT